MASKKFGYLYFLFITCVLLIFITYKYIYTMGNQRGTVKFHDSTKGFGFILPDEGGNDIYFRNDGLSEQGVTLNENDKVTFDVADGDGGSARPNAVNISRDVNTTD